MNLSCGFSTVTEDQVNKVISEINSKSVGSNGISIQINKAVSHFATGSITHLMKECIVYSVFPHSWKLSTIWPLPKVANPKRVDELKPISILPAFSKILEKFVNCQILTHVYDAGILSWLQSGKRGVPQGICLGPKKLFNCYVMPLIFYC